MSDKAFGEWADNVREIIKADGSRPFKDRRDWRWSLSDIAIDVIAPELVGFNPWCQSRFGQEGLEFVFKEGEMTKLTCLDPTEFFAETKTPEELVVLLTHKQAFIRDAARNAFLKRKGDSWRKKLR